MKFYGAIGFAASVESPPDSGVWVDEIIEKKFYGEIIRPSRTLEEADKVNHDRSISNRFSLIATDYILDHQTEIEYITWRGVRYLARNIVLEHPRIIISPGGVYNGPTPEAPGAPSDD